MDTDLLIRAFDDFLDAAECGGFEQPLSGWDAPRVMAHVLAVNNHVMSTALAVRAGLRVAYDNRPTREETNLRRIIREGDVTTRIRRGGELLRAVVEQLTDADLEVALPVLVVSDDQVLVDEALPLLWLVNEVAANHLPQHTKQLRAMRG